MCCLLGISVSSIAGVWIHPKATLTAMNTQNSFIDLGDGRLMYVENGAIRTTADEGKTWSEPTPINFAPGPRISNVPGYRLLKTQKGTILLAYMDLDGSKWSWTDGEPGPDVCNDIWVVRSEDGGKTWKENMRVLKGYTGALNDFKQNSDGTIVLPAMDLARNPGRHVCFTFISKDDGKTWLRSNTIDLGGAGDHDGATEPSVAELSGGKMLMVIRTNLDQFWFAYSQDDGRYWRAIHPSGIDASSAMGYLLKLKSGRLALAWNRLYPEGKNEWPRTHSKSVSEAASSWFREELSIAFSEDDGKSWSEPVVVTREVGAQQTYPYMIERAPGEIWLQPGAYGTPLVVKLQEKDFLSTGKLKLMDTWP
jgi:sialidase-1